MSTRLKLRRLVVPAIVAATLATPLSWAEPVEAPHVTAELLTGVTTASPGSRFEIGVSLEPEPGWHLYWSNPGDSGLPTTVEWNLPEGWAAGPLRYPYPARFEDDGFTSYGYGEKFVLSSVVEVPTGSAPAPSMSLGATLEWTVCREELCVPGEVVLSGSVEIGRESVAADSATLERFAATASKVPASSSKWTVSAAVVGETIAVLLQPAAGVPAPARVEAFESVDGAVDRSQPARLGRFGDTLVVALRSAAAAPAVGDRLAAVLVADRSWDPPSVGLALAVDAVLEAPTPGLTDFVATLLGDAVPGGTGEARGQGSDRELDAAVTATAADAVATTIKNPDPAAPSTEATGPGFLIVILMAFLGGLLLNLMPCVFPVLALKVLGFVESSGGGSPEVRRHGLAFAAGVIAFFWLLAGSLLALRAGGAQLGWGFQLQSPPFVGTMTLLLFAVGLNLAGVFEFGGSVAARAGRLEKGGGGLGASFANGALATVLATPCTAPFMGSALGYALVQPVVVALAVFTALGVGMASPYVALAYVPSLAARLPRPGAWMETLRQILAFPVFATTVWLVWVFGRQTGVDGVARLLGAAVVVAGGAWCWGRFGALVSAANVRRRAAVVSVAMGGLAVLIVVSTPAASVSVGSEIATDGPWRSYDASDVARHVADGRAVFVDFTAAWCLTCQVNKRVALETDAVRRRFRSLDVVTVKADWTDRDDSITQALEEFGRSGVPLYVLWPGGGNDPVILPQVLTPQVVLDALDAVVSVASKEPSAT